MNYIKIQLKKVNPHLNIIDNIIHWAFKLAPFGSNTKIHQEFRKLSNIENIHCHWNTIWNGTQLEFIGSSFVRLLYPPTVSPWPCELCAWLWPCFPAIWLRPACIVVNSYFIFLNICCCPETRVLISTSNRSIRESFKTCADTNFYILT